MGISEGMRSLSLDFETFSSVNLKDYGAYKYAEGPDTEVLVLAVQEHGSNEVLSWDIRQPHNASVELLRQAVTEGWEIHAYNAQFEYVILRYVCTRQFGFPLPKIESMRCTAAVCRSAGLPPTLEKAAKFLQLPIQKDTIGKALIKTFSVPGKKGERKNWDTEGEFTLAGSRVSYADAFQKFVDYCVQDVRTEVSVSDAMKDYALKGFTLDWFHLDMRVNQRGVPVDLVALQAAYDMFREKEAQLTRRFKEITGLSPTQRDRCLEWFQKHGYKSNKMTKDARAAALKQDNLSEEVMEALTIKSQLGYAALKKIPSMLSMAMSDSKIRGSFLWCGAQKTGRWTSKTPQWQNMKKPPKWLRPGIEDTYQTLKNRDLDMDTYEFIYGPPYEVIASLARYFVRFPDRNIFDLDFSSVEARILPALIGADRIMEKIRTGGDIYTATGDALNALLKEKYKVDFSIDRDIAKTVVLATQFQGGWHAVYTATGEKWNRAWCDTAVEVVRKENPEFPAAWRAFQLAFEKAMDNPHKWVKATEMVSFAYTTRAPFPRMLMKLPSGRNITYPYPKKAPITMAKVITKDSKGKAIKAVWERVAGHYEDKVALCNYMDVGDSFIRPNQEVETYFPTFELSFHGHIEGKLYGRVSTYGGDLLQSATQGTGADLLAYGALAAEKRGFEPFFLVHDQALAPDDGRKEEFVEAMCTIPDWFKGFPLEADADSVRSYCKA